MSSLLRSLTHRLFGGNALASPLVHLALPVALDSSRGRSLLGWLTTVVQVLDRPIRPDVGPRCQRCNSVDVARAGEVADDSEWPLCTLAYVYECHACGHLWEEHSVVTDLLSPWG